VAGGFHNPQRPHGVGLWCCITWGTRPFGYGPVSPYFLPRGEHRSLSAVRRLRLSLWPNDCMGLYRQGAGVWMKSVGLNRVILYFFEHKVGSETPEEQFIETSVAGTFYSEVLCHLLP
jgi:hypothetical protein